MAWLLHLGSKRVTTSLETSSHTQGVRVADVGRHGKPHIMMHDHAQCTAWAMYC